MIAAIGALCATILSFVSGRASWWPAVDRAVSDWAIRQTASPEAGQPAVRVLLVDGPLDPDTLGDWLDRLAGRKPAAVVIDHPIRGAKGIARPLARAAFVVGLYPGPEPVPDSASLPIFGDSRDLDEAPTCEPLPPAVAEAAEVIGLTTIPADRDGVVRRVPLVRRLAEPERAVAGSALAGLIAAFGDRALQLGGDGLRLIGFSGSDVPIDRGGSLTLRFRGPARTLSTIELGAIDLGAAAALDAVQPGDFVVLGRADETLPTPTDDAMSRAEVIGTAVDNLLRGDPLRTAHPALALLHAALVGVFGALAIGGGRRGELLRCGVVLVMVTIGPIFAGVLVGQILSGTSVFLCGAVGAAGAHAARKSTAPP